MGRLALRHQLAPLGLCAAAPRPNAPPPLAPLPPCPAHALLRARCSAADWLGPPCGGLFAGLVFRVTSFDEFEPELPVGARPYPSKQQEEDASTEVEESGRKSARWRQASSALRNSAIESVKRIASTKFLRPTGRKNQLYANVNPMKQSLNLFHAENDPIALLDAANAKAEANRRALANANADSGDAKL